MLNHQKRYQLARDNYRDIELVSRVQGASPHALVTLLYEQLLQSLDVMLAHHSLGHSVQRDQQYLRATSILVALQASLDHENGGALAERLAKIYGAVTFRLSRAVEEQNGELLLEVRAGLAEIAVAWADLAASHAKPNN
jgi:flagellar secretion chaperone FliS